MSEGPEINDSTERLRWLERENECLRAGLEAKESIISALHAERNHLRESKRVLEAVVESQILHIEGMASGIQHIHNLAHNALAKGGLEEALENIQITTSELIRTKGTLP